MSEFYKYLMTGKMNEAMDNVNPNFVQLKQAIEQAIDALNKAAPMGMQSSSAAITNQILYHLGTASTLMNKLPQ